MPLGGSADEVTSLDTSRIGREGTDRTVWLRRDSLRRDPEGRRAIVPGTARETLHRIRCGARTVDDLEVRPERQRGLPGPTDVLTTRRERPFADHPYGAKVFPTVCTAIGQIGTAGRS